jgi:hypothetical protein
MCWTKDQKLLSCASDRYVKMFDPYNTQPGAKPIWSHLGTNAYTSLSRHRSANSFAASSGVIEIFDLERHSSAPEVLKWPTSTDTITAVSNFRSAGFPYELRTIPDHRVGMEYCLMAQEKFRWLNVVRLTDYTSGFVQPD